MSAGCPTYQTLVGSSVLRARTGSTQNRHVLIHYLQLSAAKSHGIAASVISIVLLLDIACKLHKYSFFGYIRVWSYNTWIGVARSLKTCPR